MSRHDWIIGSTLILMMAVVAVATGAGRAPAPPDYLRAAYSPLHFRPAIEKATDAECLACHREILDDSVRKASPAGMPAARTAAAYQQLSTYSGAQDTFHRRHLTTPLAQELMNLRCNTCHQGHDVREEAQGSSATVPPRDNAFTLRKQVNVETTCLKCHGQMHWQNMNLPGPWPEVSQIFANSCTASCHDAIRTTRHQVTYLKAAAIEAAGSKNADVCYGCHGGRAWYRIAYPYARHAWPDMTPTVPDWAKNRPTESEARFRLDPAARDYKP